MRHTSKRYLLIGVLGLVVLSVTGQASAAGFGWPDWWGDMGRGSPFGPLSPIGPGPTGASSADLASQLATDLNNVPAC